MRTGNIAAPNIGLAGLTGAPAAFAVDPCAVVVPELEAVFEEALVLGAEPRGFARPVEVMELTTGGVRGLSPLLTIALGLLPRRALKFPLTAAVAVFVLMAGLRLGSPWPSVVAAVPACCGELWWRYC